MWPVVGALGGVLLGGVISWISARANDQRRFEREDLTRWDADIRDGAAKMIALISRSQSKVARFQRLSAMQHPSDEHDAEELALGAELYNALKELDLLRAELALVAPSLDLATSAFSRRFEETIVGEWLGEGPDGNQQLGQKVPAKHIPLMVSSFTDEVRGQLRVDNGGKVRRRRVVALGRALNALHGSRGRRKLRVSER